MDRLIIELIFCITFTAFSTFVYFYRSETFKKTIIRKQKRKYNSLLNYLFVLIVIGYVLLQVSNVEFYVAKEFTKNNNDLYLANINQVIFWTSVIITIKSFKYVKKEEYVEFDFPSRREAREGDVPIGKILDRNKEKYTYCIKLEDLAKHMFVMGITGSGKSNLLQYFLINYTKKFDTPFLLAEFKGEYRYLQRIIPNLLVYKVGDNFCINIFDPEGTNHEVHAERIFQIFRSGGLFEGTEYSPQMERVFIDVLRRVCKDPSKRSWDGFYKESKAYLEDIVKETRDLSYRPSIEAVGNRIRRYSLGTLKHAFESKVGLPIKELFEHNVLMDVSNIINLGGEKEDTLFFLNMLFKYLRDMNIQRGAKNYKGIRHITIIEDAQYFASQSITDKSTISTYIEDVALLLRGTGECLISLATRPAVSSEILANCGVFITFQNHIQKDFLEDLINFGNEEKKFLSMLNTGDCLVRVNSIGKPFALRVPLMNRSWLEDSEIKEANENILTGMNEKKENIENKSVESKEKKIREPKKEIFKKKFTQFIKKPNITKELTATNANRKGEENDALESAEKSNEYAEKKSEIKTEEARKAFRSAENLGAIAEENSENEDKTIQELESVIENTYIEENQKSDVPTVKETKAQVAEKLSKGKETPKKIVRKIF